MKFCKSHEWVKVDGDIATMGISDHAQNELTELCFIELPSEGKTFKLGDPFCVVESVKSASDVYCPVSGEIIEVNNNVIDDPSIVNADAEGEGWFLKIKMSAPEEYDTLLSKDDYLSLVS